MVQLLFRFRVQSLSVGKYYIQQDQSLEFKRWKNERLSTKVE